MGIESTNYLTRRKQALLGLWLLVLVIAGMSCARQIDSGSEMSLPLERSQFMVVLQQAPSATDDAQRLVSTWAASADLPVRLIRVDGVRVIIGVSAPLTTAQQRRLLSDLAADPRVKSVEADMLMQPMRTQ